MKHFLLGWLVGCLMTLLLTACFIEVVHQHVELDAEGSTFNHFCNLLYDAVSRTYREPIAFTVKVTYKVFAWPVHTAYLLLREGDDNFGILHQPKADWEWKKLHTDELRLF